MEYEEVQTNEVEALKAIYASDFRALANQSAWNKSPSPKFVIRLRPSTEFANSAIEVQIQFLMTPTYPKTLPQTEIVKSASLSGRQIETLKQIIDRTVKSLKGSEMVFEVTSNIQSQIDEWARFVAEAAPNLEEDRLRRLRIAEREQKEHQDRLQQERESAAHKVEQKYDSLVLEELKRSEKTQQSEVSKNRHRLSALSPENLADLLVVPENTKGVTTFARPIRILRSFKREDAVFRQVMDGLIVPQSGFGTTYLAKALLPPNFNEVSESNEGLAANNSDIAVLMTKIGLSTPYWRSAAGARQLHDLNTELELIRELKLSGVLPLCEFAIERFKNPALEWMITIVNPYSHLMTMDDMLNGVDKINFKSAQTWSFQILETLEDLHKAGLRHSMVCPSMAVIKVDLDTGERSVVLRHPQYFYTLMQLNEQHPFEENRPSYDWLETIKHWIPPEGRGAANVVAVPSKKWDVWQFGALITCMIAGKRALYDFRGDPETYVRSMVRVWPNELTSFLLAVLHPDPAKRPGVLELMTDQFFRTDLDDYQIDSVSVSKPRNHSFSTASRPTLHGPALSSSMAAKKHEEPNGGNGSGEPRLSPPVAAFNRRRLSSNDEVVASRYRQDFDEGIVLGRGGFGQVVKARNKLDGRIYAVKKVKATSKTMSHILQEVVLLSRLNHQYVVRYYTVWLEDESDDVNGEQTLSTVTDCESATPSQLSPNQLSSNQLSSNQLSPRLNMAEPLSEIDLLDALPSTSLSRYSPHSLSELDMPSMSQDFMSDSGFVEFGYSDGSSGNDSRTSKLGTITSAGNSQDSESAITFDDSSVETPGRSELGVSRRPNNIASKILYIQMEYCENHTLADLVKQGLANDPHEYWRLLREMLEALAYIHSEGVIHRDLKPKNIFIDQNRNIKIGDFGLARSVGKQLQSYTSGVLNSTTVDGIAGTERVSGSKAAVDDEDLTTDVGTSLYAAVEVMRSERRGYNEKVDIFSLGIIFFEMVYRFGTEMERIQNIRNARKPQIELPAKLTSDANMETQVALIKSMLNHNPEKRPSASTMLHSGMIPVEDREMTIREAISNVRDPRVVQQLTTELFARPRLSAQDVLYDRVNTTATVSQKAVANIPHQHDFLMMSYVQDTLKTVFRTHGAIENTTLRPRLFPKSTMYKSATVVEVLDQHGTVLQLPYDLTLPHARRLAEIVPDYSKAFAVDSVYRNRLQSTSQHPFRHIEVDFDIVSHDCSDDSIVYNDAETIAVMYDSANIVLNHGIDPKTNESDLIVVVGHQDIVSATLSQCGLVPPQFNAALSLLLAGPIDRRAALARSNISSASLDMLSNFGFRENIAQAEGRMSRQMSLSDRVKRGLNHLQKVSESFLRICASQNQPTIYFSPLVSTTNAEFYIGGIVFQLISVKGLGVASARKFGSGSVLAVGGRYDSLIKTFRNSVLDGRTPLARAVGFGMSADKLEMLVSKSRQYSGLNSSSLPSTASIPVPPRCQVLVGSLSEESVKEHGVDILKVLWACGIRADVVRESMSTEGLMAIAQQDNIAIVVLIKQGHSLHNVNKSFKPLRVKKTGPNGFQSQGDTDLAFNELVPFVKNELGIPLPHIMGDIDALATDSNTTPEIDLSSERVIVLNESGRLKGGRKNKWQIEERSIEARTQLLAELNNAPIISLDLRDEVLEAITTVSPHATEDWKRRVVGLSPNQKAYIMTIQAKLSNEATRAPRLLLYSTKTENITVYNYK